MEAVKDGEQSVGALLLVYDVGDRSTFMVLPEIYHMVHNLSENTDFPVAVLANKVDVFQDSREASSDEGRDFAEHIGGMFEECSAREGDKVRGIFHEILRLAVKARLRSLEAKESKAKQEQEAKQKIVPQPVPEKPSKRSSFKRSVSEKILSRLSSAGN